MTPSVKSKSVAINSKCEGVVPWMYLDVKGLVTTAIGCLCDDPVQVRNLPFLRPDGTPASGAEITAEWNVVKSHKEMEMWGGGSFSHVTKLRLTPDGIATVVGIRLEGMDRFLSKRFPEYSSWPEQVQIALLSISWACGPAFHYPHMEAALKLKDWRAAAENCHISEDHNPGVKPRNEINKALFLEAAAADLPEAAHEEGPC